MEKEMESQKKKEKEAKKMADLARFKMRGNVSESWGSFGEFMTHLMEFEDEEIEDTDDPTDPAEERLRQQAKAAEKRLSQHKRREAIRRERQQAKDDTHANQDPRRIASP